MWDFLSVTHDEPRNQPTRVIGAWGTAGDFKEMRKLVDVDFERGEWTTPREDNVVGTPVWYGGVDSVLEVIAHRATCANSTTCAD